MKVRNAMHRGVTWVDAKTPVAKVARQMRTEDIGAIPVGEDDRLIGIVTDRDICCRGVGNGAEMKRLSARDVMSKPLLYCSEDDDIEAAVRVMKKNKVRRLPVINARKRLVGMLSLGDISSKAAPRTTRAALRAVTAHHA